MEKTTIAKIGQVEFKDLAQIVQHRTTCIADLKSAGLEFQVKKFPQFFDSFLGGLEYKVPTALAVISAWDAAVKKDLQGPSEYLHNNHNSTIQAFTEKSFDKIIGVIIKDKLVAEEAIQTMGEKIVLEREARVIKLIRG
jgi:hypothetical protein